MAEYLSYAHALNVVRGVYEDRGFKLHDKTPGKSVTKEIGQSIEGCKLGALFAMIDELIFILRYQNYYLAGCVFNQQNSRCINNLRFCTGMLSTLCSIRVLSGMGLDLNARGQLRYYYELSLLWSRLQLDRDAQAKFEVVVVNQSNEYWHKYIAKRRCEKYLFEGAKAGNFDWSGAAAQDHIDDIYDKLSLSAHPGFWGLYFNASNDLKTIKDTIIGGGPENSSQFTLSSAILLTTLPFGVNGVTNWHYKSPKLFDPAAIYPPLPGCEDWSAYAHELRAMILGLALFSFRFATELAGGKW